MTDSGRGEIPKFKTPNIWTRAWCRQVGGESTTMQKAWFLGTLQGESERRGPSIGPRTTLTARWLTLGNPPHGGEHEIVWVEPGVPVEAGPRRAEWSTAETPQAP